jgi:hypothetical protein
MFKKGDSKGAQRLHELYPEKMKGWCKKGGKRVHESYPNLAIENGKKLIGKRRTDGTFSEWQRNLD